jgi:hypothetical protein
VVLLVQQEVVLLLQWLGSQQQALLAAVEFGVCRLSCCCEA